MAMALDTTDFSVRKVAAPLRQDVTDNIRHAIVLGRYKSGDRLPERELCELIGVSRTLIREALRQLESEGIIRVIPHRGPVVASITPEQAEGVYQVREELECLASRLFAENADEAQKSALRKTLLEVKAAYKSDNPLDRLRAKSNFYNCLIDGSGNEALGITLHLLNSRIILLRSTSLQAPKRTKASLKELTELTDSLIAGDSKRAVSLSRDHVRCAAEAALGILREAQRVKERSAN